MIGLLLGTNGVAEGQGEGNMLVPWHLRTDGAGEREKGGDRAEHLGTRVCHSRS